MKVREHAVVNNFDSRPLAQSWPKTAQKWPPRRPKLRSPPVRQYADVSTMHNDTRRSSLRPCHVPPASSTCEVETPSTRVPSFASLLPSSLASTSHACAGAHRQPWPMEQAPCRRYSLAFMLPRAELAPPPVPPSSSPSHAHLGRSTRRRSTVAACHGHRS
jgi:hypothetical protein